MEAIDKGVSGVLGAEHPPWNSGMLKPQAVKYDHSAVWRISFLLLSVSSRPQLLFPGVGFCC